MYYEEALATTERCPTLLHKLQLSGPYLSFINSNSYLDLMLARNEEYQEPYVINKSLWGSKKLKANALIRIFLCDS